MSSLKIIKPTLLIVVIITAGIALADALGFFNPKPYTVVQHGAMSHYVPYNRDPGVDIVRFPTEPPGPDELITPTGQLVLKSLWKKRKDSLRALNQQEERGKGSVKTIDIGVTGQLQYVVAGRDSSLHTGSMVKVPGSKTFRVLQRIDAHPGEMLRIRLKALYLSDKKSGNHNWILLKPGTDLQAFLSDTTKEISLAQSTKVVAYASLSPGSAKDETIFSVPAQPGEYIFLCAHPAHYERGMHGILSIK